MLQENHTSFFEYMLRFLPEKNENLKEMIRDTQQYFKPMLLKKNEFLVREGAVCVFFCFIEKGILQHAVTLEQEEKTTYLSLTNTVTSSLYSFLNQSASRKHIKALTDCSLWVIELPAFRKLIAENTAFHQFYFHLIERQICLIDDYRIDLLALTPEERYKKLLTSEPQLLQEVPLHYLASFLGISSRHMSRIRKNIL